VVFNYPAGDTICAFMQTEYYHLCYGYGHGIYEQLYPDAVSIDSLSKADQLKRFEEIYYLGSQYIRQNHASFGDIDTRPTDRRENYVKRCVGLPGQTLQIVDKVIYLDGKPNKEPDNAQFQYDVQFVEHARLTDDLLKELHITLEDLNLSTADRGALDSNGYVELLYSHVIMPMTRATYEALKKRSDLVVNITPVKGGDTWDIYPQNGNYHWTRDNYGPIWIPAKGKSIDLTLDNLPIYERCIRAYEGNQLEVKDGKIFINDKETTKYTFKMDYYWMQGDNRHNSLDSRYWGFVPEDHIVGKPIFIWWSSDPDRGGFSGIRWSRLFRFVDNIK
jgi:signal peptidase I